MNVHRHDEPPTDRRSNPLIGLVMLAMLCLTAIAITFLVTS